MSTRYLTFAPFDTNNDDKLLDKPTTLLDNRLLGLTNDNAVDAIKFIRDVYENKRVYITKVSKESYWNKLVKECQRNKTTAPEFASTEEIRHAWITVNTLLKLIF